MTTTRAIPTDKNGQVYYGPTTLAEARTAIGNIRDEMHAKMDRIGSTPDTRAEWTAKEIRFVATLRDAGYTGLAARIAKEFGIGAKWL